MEPIKCKNCPAELTQVVTGSWIDPDGFVYCPCLYTEPRLHEPIITPEWRAEIKRLVGTSSKFWTTQELARLMQLPEDTIQEILNS